MALAVQAIVGAAGPGTVQNVTPGAVGAAIGSGNLVVGACLYFNAGVANTDYISTVTDNQGNNYLLLDHIKDSTGTRWMTTFSLFNITNGPTTITGNFSATQVSASQIIWLEYSKSYSGPIAGHGGQAQNIPGITTDVITSGAVQTGLGPVVGINMNRLANQPAVGTNYTLEIRDPVPSGTNWAAMAEDLLGTGTTIAATFTDSHGSDAGAVYLSAIIALQPGCSRSGSFAMVGVGCSIGWRASLLAAGAWRAGKVIEKNGVATRRSLILPFRRHNGGPPFDD